MEISADGSSPGAWCFGLCDLGVHECEVQCGILMGKPQPHITAIINGQFLVHHFNWTIIIMSIQLVKEMQIWCLSNRVPSAHHCKKNLKIL